MPNEEWEGVDAYLEEKLLRPDLALSNALERNQRQGLPAIDVSPLAGKFLHLIARIKGARRVLEIGTLGGYSTIWLARAIPDDGLVVTLESVEHHAQVARENLRQAGLLSRVDIRLGLARDSLAQIEKEGAEPFDLIFIDADKENNIHYLQAAIRLSRPGTVIIVDNVVRSGGVADAESGEPSVVGTRALLDMMAGEHLIDATALQTVGAKGWDGFALAVVKG